LAKQEDIDDLIRLELEFEEHMRRSPINAEFESETEDAIRDGFLEQLQLPNFVTMVAIENNHVVAMAYACSTEYSNLHSGERRPPNSATFAKTVVEKQRRKNGIGLALATETIKVIQDLGFETIVSDWRLANVEASRAWAKLGFTPTWYRMVLPD
jgi:GNAT superfamily N-acetyltransferase